MPNAGEFYKPAETAVLWNLPFMKGMDHFFSEEVQNVKEVLNDTEAELERDWPYNSFRQVSKEILLNSGVMHRDSDKSKNAYKRDQWEHDRLSEYMREMITNWLRISAVIDTEDLLTEVSKLQKTAKLVSNASMWTVQREHPSIPIWAGPLVPADIMLAAFRVAAKPYQTLLNNAHAESESDQLELEEFSWGEEVFAMHEWAKSVERKQRPTLRSKKYVASSQEPPRTPAKSPSQVRRWYAAKGTSRPGAYVHKDVAESYNRDGKGTIKMFRSMARLRSWLNMPVPRMFFERECNSAPLPDAQPQTQDEEDVGGEDEDKDEEESGEEYYALKGGSEDGIFKDMAGVVQAKNRSGGAFALFSSRKEAEIYLRPKESFVVWVGRDIGIMNKVQCVKATQRLTEAQMCGPFSQEDAKEQWKAVKHKARVVVEATSAPTTPTKPVKKKSKKTPKKKYFYAVAVGKVPGVYDSWQEAEKQVKNVRKNLYAKFTTRKKAQAFVDSKGRKGATQPATEEAIEVSDDEQEDVDEASDTQGDGELEIELPTMEELQKAEEESQVRVYACHTDIGKARIALAFEDAIAGVNNPAVQVVNSHSTLLDNLAEAEVRLKNDKKHVKKSLADRLAAARKRAGASSHARKEATGPIKPAPRKKGQSVGTFASFGAVGRAKETKMISYHFLSELQAIETNYDQVPFRHELDEDMELPDTKASFNPAATIKDLTIKDFFNAKEKALPTWPLMDFQPFMSFCRKAQRLCQASSKKGAVANAAALGELMDVGLSVYRTWERLGELGVGNIRFKARMYLQLQYMSIHRVMHASAIAMTVFSDATDAFVARLPGFKGDKRSPYTATPYAGYPSSGQKTPLSGCYLCTATDHFASDTKFHPLKADGTHEKVSAEMKKAIMNRIDKSELSAAVKTAEKDRVRRWWSQHML